jgi:hypothetical protein
MHKFHLDPLSKGAESYGAVITHPIRMVRSAPKLTFGAVKRSFCLLDLFCRLIYRLFFIGLDRDFLSKYPGLDDYSRYEKDKE